MGKPMTHSEPPRDSFRSEDPNAINSRPTPAVPIRAWRPEDHEDDEPTSVIRADRLLAACEALKTGDTADLSGLHADDAASANEMRAHDPNVAEPSDAAEDPSDVTKVTEQKFWDGRPSHMKLAKPQPKLSPKLLADPHRIVTLARWITGALLLACVAALAYQATLVFAPRSPAIRAFLDTLYK
jgi:hypothetical protein